MEDITNNESFEIEPNHEVLPNENAEVLTETNTENAKAESTDESIETHEGDAEEASVPDENYYRNLEREDIRIIGESFPELRGALSLADLKNPVRYGALRDLGLTPVEAYLAVGGKKAPVGDNRSHLHSAVPREIGGIGDVMSVGELSEARELFVGLSDSEIRRLYKKVKN